MTAAQLPGFFSLVCAHTIETCRSHPPAIARSICFIDCVVGCGSPWPTNLTPSKTCSQECDELTLRQHAAAVTGWGQSPSTMNRSQNTANQPSDPVTSNLKQADACIVLRLSEYSRLGLVSSGIRRCSLHWIATSQLNLDLS